MVAGARPIRLPRGADRWISLEVLAVGSMVRVRVGGRQVLDERIEGLASAGGVRLWAGPEGAVEIRNARVELLP